MISFFVDEKGRGIAFKCLLNIININIFRVVKAEDYVFSVSNGYILGENISATAIVRTELNF